VCNIIYLKIITLPPAILSVGNKRLGQREHYMFIDAIQFFHSCRAQLFQPLDDFLHQHFWR